MEHFSRSYRSLSHWSHTLDAYRSEVVYSRLSLTIVSLAEAMSVTRAVKPKTGCLVGCQTPQHSPDCAAQSGLKPRQFVDIWTVPDQLDRKTGTLNPQVPGSSPGGRTTRNPSDCKDSCSLGFRRFAPTALNPTRNPTDFVGTSLD